MVFIKYQWDNKNTLSTNNKTLNTGLKLTVDPSLSNP